MEVEPKASGITLLEVNLVLGGAYDDVPFQIFTPSELGTWIPACLREELLLNPRFNLVGWARKMQLKAQLEEDSFYNSLDSDRGFEYLYTLFVQNISEEEIRLLYLIQYIEDRRELEARGYLPEFSLPSLTYLLDLVAERRRVAEKVKERTIVITCGGVQIPADNVNGIARTASVPRVPNKMVAKPVVVVVRVNNHPVRANTVAL
ncbi:hypothetical protein B0H13DRAFT_2313341 [Mycena leptocephala]|nr:hypothetical protein B0H13DRAFT_2313341 [Mycena leptocephala]